MADLDVQTQAPVVIVGAGLTGLSVALYFAERHLVVVLAKRRLEKGATACAQGGIVGVLADDESIESYVRHTQTAGAGLVDEHTARFVAEHSARAIEWLVSCGVPFSADPAGPLGPHLTREGGHAVRRIAHAADATASAVLHAVQHIKPRLWPRGVVANPRDTTRYRCGLRLATGPNPSIFLSASQHATLH